LLKSGLFKIGNDFEKRFLSERERIRIGRVITYAIIKYHEKLAAGEIPRHDGFFELPSTGNPACAEIAFVERPPNEEVIEGILLAVQREHEEKKLPFQGNLLVNIFFDSTIDISHANLLIKIGETISFTQMCLLSLFSEPYKSKIKGRYLDNIAFPKADNNLNSLFQEIFELGSQGLLYCSSQPVITLSYCHNPDGVEVVGAGSDLYELMELGKINEADLDSIAFKIFPQESEKYPPEKRNLLMKK
jgi:hypothetical protein